MNLPTRNDKARDASHELRITAGHAALVIAVLLIAFLVSARLDELVIGLIVVVFGGPMALHVLGPAGHWPH
jgi:hypothetical protein